MTTPSSQPARNPSLTTTVVVCTYLSSMLVGFINSGQGPMLGSIKTQFGVNDAQVAWLFSMQFLGAMLGNASGVWLKGIPAGWRMTGGFLLFAFGCFGVVGSSNLLVWSLALLCIFVTGLGFGTFQVNYVAVFSRGFGARSGAVMGVMATSFGIGAMLGPFVAGLLLEHKLGFGVLYLGCGLMALCIAGFAHGVREVQAMTRTVQTTHDQRLGWAGFALFSALYVAAEVGVSNWSPSHLHEGLGFSSERAAFLTAFFWVAVTAGRALSAPLSLRFSSQTLIVGSLVVSALGLLLAHVPVLAFAGYWVAGLGFAAVFPGGLVWLGRLFTDPASTSVYVLAGSFGALLSAPLVGWLKLRFGPNVIPSVMLGFNLAALLVVMGLIKTFPMPNAGPHQTDGDPANGSTP